jgi:hypothetical protein
VPFINGKFYMNPAHGRALERARAAESRASDPIPEQGSRWVTISGRHVLIGETQEGRAPHENGDIRRRIAETARKYDGSKDWAYAKQKGNFPRNSNKCNQYVYDVTKEAGAEAAVIGSDGKRRPPLAAEWADPNTKIENWLVLGSNETPQPDDVAAYKQPGGGAQFSGHSGIVTSIDSNGLVRAMAAHDQVIGTDDKFNPGVGAAVVTYRRFTGDSL